jgi:hypothetical protein
MNARGFQQMDGNQFDSSSIAYPVANEVTIIYMFVLILTTGRLGDLFDVKGNVLHWGFDNGDKIYMEAPQRFDEWFGVYVVLILLKALHGLKMTMVFWKELLKTFASMEHCRSKVDPGLYFRWTHHGLIW